MAKTVMPPIRSARRLAGTLGTIKKIKNMKKTAVLLLSLIHI